MLLGFVSKGNILELEESHMYNCHSNANTVPYISAFETLWSQVCDNSTFHCYLSLFSLITNHSETFSCSL